MPHKLDPHSSVTLHEESSSVIHLVLSRDSLFVDALFETVVRLEFRSLYSWFLNLCSCLWYIKGTRFRMTGKEGPKIANSNDSLARDFLKSY